MKILVYRYNSIYETAVIETFRSFGLTVDTEETGMNRINLKHSETAAPVYKRLIKQADSGDPYLFVFSMNFFPGISEVCEKLGVLYVCWSVDCPVMELFFKQITNSCNRIFLFDKAQYDRFSSYNPEHIYHLPLASYAEYYKKTIHDISFQEEKNYSADISFVGSLYSEKNPLKNIHNLSDYDKGVIDGLLEAQMRIYGYYFLEESLSEELIEKLKNSPVDTRSEELVEPIDRYAASHFFLDFALAEKERIYTLNRLAEHFSVRIYTQSDTRGVLKNVENKGIAKTFTQMPKVFHESRINLNMTMRGIQTGLPLRIFDILGCEGFLMTNYQPELDDLFEIGVDLEAYSSVDELIDKCAYYLSHEDERAKIAHNGYRKATEQHNMQVRMRELIRIISS